MLVLSGAHVILRIKMALPTQHCIVWILLHSVIIHLVHSRLLSCVVEPTLVVLVLEVLVVPVWSCSRTNRGLANPSALLVCCIEVSCV